MLSEEGEKSKSIKTEDNIEEGDKVQDCTEAISPPSETLSETVVAEEETEIKPAPRKFANIPKIGIPMAGGAALLAEMKLRQNKDKVGSSHIYCDGE